MCRAPPVTMATLPPSLMSSPQKARIMECWNIGIGGHHFIVPSFHYSNVPFFSSQPFQMFFEVQRLPPRLDPERLGDDARRVVTRSAGDVTARLTGRATQIKTADRRSGG